MVTHTTIACFLKKLKIIISKFCLSTHNRGGMPLIPKASYAKWWFLMMCACLLSTSFYYDCMALRKPVLLPITADLIFHYEHNSIWINFQISHAKQATLKWSTFADCFSVAQWWSIQAAWGSNGSFTNLWMAAQLSGIEWRCLLWCWMKMSTLHLQDLNGLMHPYAFPLKPPSYPPSSSATHQCWNLPDTVNTE